MSQTLRFIKMEGIGNDYVYINGFDQHVPDPAATARKIADRHFGVGGDGLILVLPPEPGVAADVRMRMFNADGGESEMCGNGVRCVCKLAHDYRLSDANPMRVQTGRGVLSLAFTLDGCGKVDSVTVDMGEPILEATEIPTTLPGPRVIDHPLAWSPDEPEHAWMSQCGLDPRITCVSMGNPHAVLYCRDVQAVPLAQIGPVLERWDRFPRRTNVHFVQVQSKRELTMRTWERGSGITLACGTGAAAVCVAGVLTGRTGREVLAHLPGGDLNLRFDEDSNHVFKTGPAREVFSGSWTNPDAPKGASCVGADC